MVYPYYAVAIGKYVGIFTSSGAATASTTGVSGASMMGFKTLGSAIWWLATTSAAGAATVGLGVVGLGAAALIMTTDSDPVPKCSWWQEWC